MTIHPRSFRRLYRRARAFAAAPRMQVQHTVTVAETVPFCRNPIFVVGLHRSGTSLLRRILNAHPQIACPPESFFLEHFMDFFARPVSRTGLASIVGAEHVDRTIRETAFRAHNAFAQAQGKSRWADKTPGYLARLDDLQALAPPESQVIALLRDPFDVAFSLVERGWFLEKAATDIFEDTLIYLRRHGSRLADLAERGDAIVLRYEDYVQRPEASLRPVFAALGMPWSGAVLAPWDVPQNFGVEDPVVRGLKRFSPSIGNWRGFAPERIARLIAEIGDLRQRLGYGP